MYQPRRPWALLAGLAVAAMAVVHEAFYRLREAFTGFCVSAAKAFERVAPSAPPVLMVKARQYKAVLQHRQAPIMTASWRMFPSV